MKSLFGLKILSGMRVEYLQRPKDLKSKVFFKKKIYELFFLDGNGDDDILLLISRREAESFLEREVHN